MDEGSFLWEHFKFNAEQRLKGFNFFVLLSTFTNGGILTAIEKGLHPSLLALLGLFIVVVSTVFWLVDARSRQLLSLAVPGLKEFESNFSEKGRLFTLDTEQHSRFVRYTFAIQTLLTCQLIFGVGVLLWFGKLTLQYFLK